MNYCTLLIGIGHREQVFQWAGSVGEIARIRLEIERKLDRADRLRSRARIYPDRRSIKLHRRADSLTFFDIHDQEGTSPS
jgi:hypothetical protein